MGKTLKEEKPKQKTYFDVKMEVLLPATVIYRVLAIDAESALLEVKNNTVPAHVKYVLGRKKDIKVTIYDAGCTVIKFMKNLGSR